MCMNLKLRSLLFAAALAGLTAPIASNADVSGHYSYFVFNDKASILYYADSTVSGHLTIPDTLGGYPVAEIIGAFWGCADLTGVTLPASVTSLGDWAFADCVRLADIEIPDGVATLGTKAFYNCALPHVVIPEGVTNIGDLAFGSCTNLQDIVIPDSVTSLGSDVFNNCSGMTNAMIGGGVASLGVGAFRGCTQLINVALSGALAQIGDYAFADCLSLARAVVPAGVTNVGYGAFANCSSLESVFFAGDAPSFYEASSTFGTVPAIIYHAPGREGWDSVEFPGHALVPWHAVVLSGPSPGFADGLFGFTIFGGTNMPLVVESCTHLADDAWAPSVNTATDSSGAYRFSDAASADKPSCFYRVVFPE